MGLFDKMLKGLGFETTETELMDADQAPKKKKARRNAFEEELAALDAPPRQDRYAGFSFGPSFYNNDSASMQLESSSGVQLSKNVIIYSPKTQEDIKNIIDFLKRKEPIIVNFAALSAREALPCLSFVNGALYALKGSIHPIADDLFLLTPEGVSILVPKEQLEESLERKF